MTRPWFTTLLEQVRADHARLTPTEREALRLEALASVPRTTPTGSLVARPGYLLITLTWEEWRAAPARARRALECYAVRSWAGRDVVQVEVGAGRRAELETMMEDPDR